MLIAFYIAGEAGAKANPNVPIPAIAG